MQLDEVVYDVSNILAEDMFSEALSLVCGIIAHVTDFIIPNCCIGLQEIIEDELILKGSPDFYRQLWGPVCCIFYPVIDKGPMLVHPVRADLG